MMFQDTFKWRLSAHVSRQADTFRIKSGRHAHRRTFVALDRWDNLKALPQSPLAAPMHDTRGSPDFFIGKSGRLLLKKVDETALPLKGRQQHEPGCMQEFRESGRAHA